MKIVLVSPFNIANYGAILQGWALRTVLERMGHNVQHLNVPWVWHGVRRWWQILYSRSIANIIIKIKINGMLRRAYALMGDPPMTRPYGSLKELIKAPPYADCYIAGSDQIWGEDRFVKRKDIDLVLLNFGGVAVLRLAYAPSLAKACWSEVGRQCAAKFRNLFSRFKELSAREDSGCRLVSEFSGRKCVWVPDPTLLLTQKDYLGLLGFSSGISVSQAHVFTYLLGFGMAHRRKLVSLIIKDILKHDATINDVCNVQVPDDLSRWLFGLISARYVVTNSFHGLCFALIFHRPFVMVGFDGGEEWRNERVKSLLNRIGLLDRFVVSYDEQVVESIVESDVDWNNVDCAVNAFRQVGIDFIKTNLE